MAKKKNKSSSRKRQLNTTLKSLFRMSQEQLEQRRKTGGGPHKTRKDMPRSEQKRQAVNEQLD